MVWSHCGAALRERLERVQNYAMRIIMRKPPRTHSEVLRDSLGWTTLATRRHGALLCQVHRCVNNQAPTFLCTKFYANSNLYSGTRGTEKLHLGRPSSRFLHSSFEFQGALHYNSLPRNITSIKSRQSFKKALWKYFITTNCEGTYC